MGRTGWKSYSIREKIVEALKEEGDKMTPPKNPSQVIEMVLKSWLKARGHDLA